MNEFTTILLFHCLHLNWVRPILLSFPHLIDFFDENMWNKNQSLFQKSSFWFEGPKCKFGLVFEFRIIYNTINEPLNVYIKNYENTAKPQGCIKDERERKRDSKFLFSSNEKSFYHFVKKKLTTWQWTSFYCILIQLWAT